MTSMATVWVKQQLIEAHILLDAMGVPDHEIKRDPRTLIENVGFTLTVPQRIQWLRENWRPK